MKRKPIENDLNDLSGKEWIQLTRTWFLCDSHRYHKNKDVELHPARYPEEMVAGFLRFFTKAGGWVLDPFAGSGATLISCAEEGRKGVGVELSEKYARVAETRMGLPGLGEQTVVQGDSRQLGETGFWESKRDALEKGGLTFAEGLPQFDFSISSPPYGNMLRTSRGNVYSKQQKRRDRAELDSVYSEDSADVGNVGEYGAFVEVVADIYRGVARTLKRDAYLVIVVQNFRAPDGEVKPLAFDLTRALMRDLLFQGEKVWCQNTKPLGIWGYPKVFVPNYHHHYCLIFRNRKPPGGQSSQEKASEA